MIFFFLFLYFLQPGGAEDVTPRPHAPTINLEKTPVYPKTTKKNGPVILDARAPFDYALGHLPGAISIRWQDFSQIQEPHRGGLDPDLNLLSRKLRYLGIDPDREVVVLGAGTIGKGEEGRIAWMLKYLGIKNVRIKNANYSGRKTVEDSAAVESVPPWNPHPISTLRIKFQDFLDVAENRHTNDSYLIDVRELKSGEDSLVIPGAVKIPWKLFVNDAGDPVSPQRIKEILMDHKLNLESTLIFYSENGVSSGYVTFAVSQAGIKARNYDGGYDEYASMTKGAHR